MKKNIIVEINRIKEMMGLSVNDTENRIDEQLAIGFGRKKGLLPSIEREYGDPIVGLFFNTDDRDFEKFKASKEKIVERAIEKRKLILKGEKISVEELISVIGITNEKRNPSILDERSASLEKYMDPESKRIWSECKVRNAYFYYYILGGQPPHRSDKLLSTISSTNKRRARRISVGDYESQNEKRQTEPKKVEGITAVDYLDSTPTDTKFELGSPKLNPDYVETFKQLFRETLDLAIAQAQKQETEQVKFPGIVYISEVKINSSSSRVPQTGLPEPYKTSEKDTSGFLALSKDRALALEALIKEFIQDTNNNIVTDGNTKFTINFQGEHGDGTSGPDWDRTKGNKHPDYKEAQMAEMTITFQIAPRVTPEEMIEEKITEADGYSIGVTGFYRDTLVIRIPKIKFNLGKWLRPLGNGTYKARPRESVRKAPECPVFD